MSISVIANKIKGKRAVKVAGFEIDATLREVEDFTNELPKFPLGDGYTLSDSIIHNPLVVSIDGVVTDSPVVIFGGFGEDRASTIFSEDTRKQKAFEFFRDLVQGDSLIEIESIFTQSKKMAVKSFTPDTSPETGEMMTFTLVLYEIDVAESSTVPLPASQTERAGDASTQNAGKSTTKAVDAKDAGAESGTGAGASFLSRIKTGIRNFVAP